MKLKKILSFVLSLSILMTFIAFSPVCAEAVEITDFECSYSGYYDSVTKFDFSIYNVDKEKGTFNGHVIIKDNESSVDVDKDVSGTIEYYADYFICNFSVKYRWLFSSYTATFKITVHPFEGTATGSGGGGILLGIDDFQLYGSTLDYYSEDFSYNENDMKMCMALSF